MSADVCLEPSFVKLRNSRKLRTLLQLLIAGWKQLLCSFFPALFPSPILDSSWKKMLNIFSCKNEISFSSIIQIFYVSFSNVSLISCHLYRFSWHLDPVGIYLFKAVMEKPEQSWSLPKVNNKDTRTTSLTSFWCLYC